MINELSADMAFKIGKIQGLARFIKIVKLSEKERNEALDTIYKIGEEINQINKDLSNTITATSSEKDQ